MASIDVGSERGGKKAVDSSIPLIPFIDLLLCCVMFLLVTAVWNQLASHDVVQDVPGQHANDPPPERLRLLLSVRHEGYVVSSTAGDRIDIPKVAGVYDRSTLQERLQAYRQGAPDQRALTVIADDGVIYDAVIQAMDVAAGQGFTGLAISDG